MGVSGPQLHAFQQNFKQNPYCACLHAVNHLDIGEALVTGPALHQLMRSGEEQFDKHFADTFGQLSEQDLPQGTSLSHAARWQSFKAITSAPLVC